MSRWGKGCGGVGELNTGSHLQDWESSLCCFFFLFWSVVQITEKYNVDYCFKCGGFRGFNANKKTPEGVYAGCVGVRKNYRYVEWQWKVE